MAALQITVGGSAQDVTALHIVDFDAANTVVFLANTFSINNQYDRLIEVGPAITATVAAAAAADPESWE